MDGRCGITSSYQSAATSEIVKRSKHVGLFIVEQRYIKYWTFTFFTFITGLLPSSLLFLVSFFVNNILLLFCFCYVRYTKFVFTCQIVSVHYELSRRRILFLRAVSL